MIQPELTKRQKEILILIPKFRYLNRAHIQSFLNHKERRLINRWLQDLSEKHYLLKKYSNTIIGKNRIPAIYSLDNNGIRFVKKQGAFDNSYLTKLYYDKNRSATFITHYLFLATICVQLDEKQSASVSYSYVTVNEWQHVSHPFQFLKTNRITADLCFSKKLKGKKRQYYLLEIFDESLPRYRIRKRVRDYFTFFFNNGWENNIKEDFPILLFVSFSKDKMIYNKRYLKKIFREYDSPVELKMYVAVAQDIQTENVTGNIWEEIT